MSQLSTASANYRVPERFSIAEILAMMTVFGFLFGALRFFGAPASLYLFLGSQAVAVCLVQMWCGAVPRGASTSVGAVFFPIWVWGMMAVHSGGIAFGIERAIVELPLLVAFGGLLGYCTGALAAGVFLVLDALSSTREWLARGGR